MQPVWGYQAVAETLRGSLDQPEPETDAPGPFWPAAIDWMRLDPHRRAGWGIPDVLLGMLSFLVGGFLAGAAVLAAGVAATGEAPEEFVDTHAGPVMIASLLGSWAASLAFLLLISRVKGQGSLRRDFGFRFSWWDPLIGAGAAVVTLLVAAAVNVVVSTVTGTELGSNTEAIFGGVEDQPVLLVIMVVMASVGAPVVEELLFRGLALRAVEKRFGGLAGVIGSAALFGIVHYDPTSAGIPALIAAIGAYGLVFAVVTRWWQRLGPAVFAHLWLNGLASVSVLVSVLVQPG